MKSNSIKKETNKIAKRKVVHGWNPDLPDHRDIVYKPKVAHLPSSIDLRNSGFMPIVYDQGQLGSCTANGIGAAIQYELSKQKLPNFMPSRLFIYFNERKIEGTIKQDAGAQIRDGIKSVAKQGVCDELIWPYVPTKFKQAPSIVAYQSALANIVTKYERVNGTEASIKSALSEGFPVVFGFTCYDSFESSEVAASGVLPMPSLKEKIVGGHCVLCVGYDDSKKIFIIRNSWGTNWGQKGYFTMPYAYLTNANLADDMWKIILVK